ncbi:hypothetical protein RJT34_30871 [Clitoria ternatea]|uniref:Uncharacterized protein n=1 Tax=Clitoria ternatea TaxID=43366 RepID=A0AAN9EUC2_CLITE
MGRAPCCDKASVKRGPWSPEEDAKLKSYIDHHGTGGNWIALPQKIGLKRCGKSCRLRWLNYLRPNIKHGGFSEEEDNIICSLYVNIGSRWSIIAAQLPGRTDNDIKNYWNTRLKKKLLGKQRKEQQAQAQARRVCNIKQEIKTESENFMLPMGIMSQSPYWPTQLPWPMSTTSLPDFHLNNQTLSLKNLANNNIVTTNTMVNSQYSFDNSLTQDQLYPSTMNMITTQGVLSTSNTCHPSNMLQGLGNFPTSDLTELVDGSMQVFYEMDMANGSTNTTSTESTSWEDINSLVYSSPFVSNLEGCQQRIPQHVTFDESSYFAMQTQ